MRRSRPVVVVQLEPLHTEVVLPQLVILREAGRRAFLVAHPFVAEQVRAMRLLPRSRVFPIPAPQRGATRRLFRALRVPSVLVFVSGVVLAGAVALGVGARRIVFTTIADRVRARVVRAFLRSERVVHIVHNVQRYDRSHRMLTARFGANVVISRDVLATQQARPSTQRMRRLACFVPAQFPRLDLPPRSTALAAPAGGIRVGVPGSVNQQRRNYRGLIDSVSAHAPLFRAAGVRFYLIGRTPRSFIRALRDHEIDDLIVAREGFWEFDEMFAAVRDMDAIAFLIDTSIEHATHYNRTKISGTSPLAIAFNKAVISSREFSVDQVLRNQTFWYPGAALDEFARAVAAETVTRDALRGSVMSRDAHRSLVDREADAYLRILDGGRP